MAGADPLPSVLALAVKAQLEVMVLGADRAPTDERQLTRGQLDQAGGLLWIGVAIAVRPERLALLVDVRHQDLRRVALLGAGATGQQPGLAGARHQRLPAPFADRLVEPHPLRLTDVRQLRDPGSLCTADGATAGHGEAAG